MEAPQPNELKRWVVVPFLWLVSLSSGISLFLHQRTRGPSAPLFPEGTLLQMALVVIALGAFLAALLAGDPPRESRG